MNLPSILQELYADKQKLERVIRALEELQEASSSHPYLPSGGRRGRKSMGPEERNSVSLRMKRYWANRRKTEQG
jgi:hypothetical protein